MVLILVCDTIHCAKEVVYDSQVKLRAVTARGDDLKPTGTMSGGAPDRRGPILMDLIDYTTFKSEIAWKQAEMEKLGKEVSKYDKVRGRYSELKDKLERASARLEALKESFKDGPLQQLSEEIKVLEKVVNSRISLADFGIHVPSIFPNETVIQFDYFLASGSSGM
ncbi:unnamed protein product [Strongylus vulgaris]|uniref:Uncharacterized protein n=1 Tax=Strongylus vulgaris TaxID=40348 RepID=A0A3P7HZ60_STRVU|nr:unnamed protein product [Strongylus vulgaris]